MSQGYQSIFNELTRLAGCQYLSDLTHGADGVGVAIAVAAIPEGNYSLCEWNALASYIMGAQMCFTDVGEAKRSLIAALRER